MSDKLIFILPVLTVIFFFITILYKGNSVETFLIFILTFLPLMELRVTKEIHGAFRTFDLLCYLSIIFLFKDFITINLKHSRNNIYFLLFILLACIMLLGNLASDLSERVYINLLKTFPIFIFGRFLLTACLKDPTFHLKFIKALKISYLIAICFMVIQVILGLKFTYYPTLSTNTYDPQFNLIRYPGFFYDSQGNGQFMAMGSFLLLLPEKSLKKQSLILNVIIYLLAILCIFLAGSRSAIAGYFVGLFLVFLMSGKKIRTYGAILVLLLCIFFTILNPPSVGIFNRTQNISDDYLFRQSLWKEAYGIVKEFPVLGIGNGNYQPYVTKHLQDHYLEIVPGELLYFDQPENGYLKVLVELGYAGFAVFALFIFIPMVKGLRYYIKGLYDSKIGLFLAALLCWLTAFNSVYSIFDIRLLIMVASMICLIISYPKTKYLINDLVS